MVKFLIGVLLMLQVALLSYGVYQVTQTDLVYLGVFNIVCNSIFGIVNIKNLLN